MKGPAVVLMARAPVPGRAKTRLQPGLTAERSAALYEAFLRDEINLLASLAWLTPVLGFTPRNSKRAFAPLVAGTRFRTLAQTGGDLGERMFDLMARVAAMGFAPVLLTGSDIPTLQPGLLLRAVEALKSASLCLGPCSDGGYYLIGANRPDERVFRNVPWSTPGVLVATLENARAAGISVVLLEESDDVDTCDDLPKLHAGIRRLESMEGAHVPRHTRAWMDQVFGTGPGAASGEGYSR